MIQRIIKTTFKLRRGHTEALREQNVLPSQGEPIFDIDLNKLKIGDGVKHYNELEYIGKSVITANSVEEFPVQGDSECLYIAADPESIYRFDAISKTYVPLYANALSNKVDKVEGKELSSNDFTDDYKSKLEGIQAGAEVNVQPDWAQNDETAVDYIKNKPTVDQTYSSTSENAQSGKAVAESIKDMPTNLVNGSSYGSLRTIRAKTMLGTCAFAEGYATEASGKNSHAEGYNTTASGNNSHAEGSYTTASSSYQHVQGKFNIEDETTYADIIGNGSSDTNRSNASTVDWNGNAWYAGDVYVGSTSGTNKDDGSKKLATEEYVDTTTTNNKLQFEDTNNDGSVVMYYNV